MATQKFHLEPGSYPA